MNKKAALSLTSLVLVFALILCGCSAKEESATVPPAETLAPNQPLELNSWSMNATAWSSPNGATVNLTAVPNGYTEGQHVVFSVRLEGEEIANVPCNWDGSVYTASADLNAADGYCYFAILNSADGTSTEVPVNTPTAVIDDSIINMASSLNTFCEASVTSARMSGSKLVIEDGNAMVHLPWLTLDQGIVSCQNAILTLTCNGEDTAQEELKVPAEQNDNICQLTLSDTSFPIADRDANGQQLSIRLDVTLSNGQILTASCGSWYYQDGELLSAVG